jgi:hypothetical protein
MLYVLAYRLAFGIIGVLLVSACSTGGQRDITIKETDLGAVYVERSDDRSLQAAHPITISKDTLARILRGITIQEEPGFLRNLVGTKPEPVSVFREEDVQFLAPLLAEGLAKAASDQQVGFRLGQAPASAEVKTGSVYAYGRSLYVTLPWLILESRYGAGGNAPSKTIVFTPASARRPDNYRRNSHSETTVVIDYELVASLPDSPLPVLLAPTPSAAVHLSPALSNQDPEGTAAQLRTLQEQMEERDVELESLKKELQEIRKQLLESRERSGKGQKKQPAAAKEPK